jgi:hypothetical protein
MMFRRTTLAAVGLAGLVLILLTVIFGLWGKSQGVQGLVKSFGPGYEPAAMRQSQADFQTVSAMGAQLQREALPGLAARLDTTPAQLSATLATHYPAVGKGLAEFPSAQSWFGDMAVRIAREKGDYEQAAAIPVKGLPATSVPWLMVIPGILLFGAAGVALTARPAWSRGVALFAVFIGLALIVAPLIVSLPAKAHAVDRLVGQFRPIMTSPGPQRTATYVSDMSAMGAQFNSEALPGLARQLHSTTPELQRMLAASYPAVGKGLGEFESIIPRFQAMSATINANVSNYRQAEALPWKGAPAIVLYWFLAIPGAVAAIGGGLILLRRQPRPLRRPSAQPIGAVAE